MQGIPPSLLKECNSYVSRVLYIQLGGNYGNNERSNIRQTVHQPLLQRGWSTTKQLTSQIYYIRNDSLTDEQLAKEVQAAIDETDYHDFEFTIFKPVYCNGAEDSFEGFARLLGLKKWWIPARLHILYPRLLEEYLSWILF